VPMSIKTYGRLGAPLMDLLRRIGCEAAEPSEFKFSSAQFVSGLLTELCVCLCKWKHQLDHVVASFFVRALGRRFQRGSYQSIGRGW
jgi:hypothetical protein